jgi:hypothetical protein
VFTEASSASGTAVPQNQTPPAVTGTAVEGDVLDADPGRWGSGSPVTFAYRWQQCQADGTGCVDVAGATDTVYPPRTGDVGHTLRVTVTATNRDGSAALASAVTTTVAAAPTQAPHNSTLPSVTGPLVVGRTLTAAPGSWTGATPIAFSYRWRRCSSSGGGCTERSKQGRTYRLSGTDANHTLRVLVTARNAQGKSASLSVASGQVTRPSVVPQNSSPPRIAGTAEEGRTLVADRGSWTNAPQSYAYSWLRCDGQGGHCSVIAGAHSAVYSLGPVDVGRTIRVEIDAKNASGTGRALSAPTRTVVAVKPPAVKTSPKNINPPTISGTPQEGRTLVGDRGTWTNSPTKYEYTWRRCDRNGHSCDGIGSAHGTTYTLGSNDVGHTIRFRVKATNAGGSNRADSHTSAVIRSSAKPENSAPPTIAGTPTEGKRLTGGKGNWTHEPTSFGYAWLRCDRNGNACATIGGAQSSTYVLTSADVGATVRLRVTAANSEGSTSAASVPTAVVQKAAAPPPPPPSRGSGCPAGSANPDQVAGITPPARLLVDTLQGDPRVVTRGTGVLVVRIHVTSTCGRPVQGALVYATATPYNQFAIPPEAATGADGWATLVFRRLRGFPVSNRQQLIAMFVRARKPGESVLGGISTRRLVSIPVRLG